MSHQLIVSNPEYKKDKTQIIDPLFSLNISEFFSETLQGEGVSRGIPAAFLRLKGCTLACSFCDSASVWRHGNRYSFGEIFEIMEESGLIGELSIGHHLVLTGGSPLKQKNQLLMFLYSFIGKYEFRPFIEIENECTIMPEDKFIDLIAQWNNSPKLENSGMSKEARYKPEILKKLSSLNNSWFKFVVTSEESWQEIEKDFLEPGLILREQIIVMPEGASRSELEKTRELTANIAIRENVRFSDRDHVNIWNLKTGV